jgi:hypothetical protein
MPLNKGDIIILAVKPSNMYPHISPFFSFLKTRLPNYDQRKFSAAGRLPQKQALAKLICSNKADRRIKHLMTLKGDIHAQNELHDRRDGKLHVIRRGAPACAPSAQGLFWRTLQVRPYPKIQSFILFTQEAQNARR